MKTAIRLAFLLPALIIATPSFAKNDRTPMTAKAPMHYVTLDRMIHEFAERARADRKVEPSTLLAKR